MVPVILPHWKAEDEPKARPLGPIFLHTAIAVGTVERVKTRFLQEKKEGNNYATRIWRDFIF